MSPFSVMATVQTEAGFELLFDSWSDGPHPREYRLQGFRVSEQRVPKQEKDELHALAWDRCRGRHEEN